LLGSGAGRGGQGEEMTQTLYAHMNKIKKKVAAFSKTLVKDNLFL
jgi:hypothetical protein